MILQYHLTLILEPLLILRRFFQNNVYLNQFYKFLFEIEFFYFLHALTTEPIILLLAKRLPEIHKYIIYMSFKRTLFVLLYERERQKT